MFSKKSDMRLLNVPVRLIIKNPDHPRMRFPEDGIARLADSIRRHGLMQPLVVRPIKDMSGATVFELVSGERRLRACRLLSMQTVPCVTFTRGADDCGETALASGLSASPLDMFEEAEAISRLMKMRLITAEEAAERLSVSVSYITDKLELLAFAPHERQMIIYAELPEKSARALLLLPEKAERLVVINAVIEGKITAAETERYVASLLSRRAEKADAASAQRVKPVIRDARIFVNTLDKAVALLRESGAEVEYEKTENMMGDLEFVIRIPSNK